MVRGTSRSESRSKKHREPSSSPSKPIRGQYPGHVTSVSQSEASAESEKEKSSVNCVRSDKAKSEEKKSAQEKREMFKSKQKEQ